MTDNSLAESVGHDSAAILCQGLTRYYGDVKAVEDLDLAVPAGSIFGFLGRNGAGKTTTIRMITGLAHPTRGQAWIAGIETTNAESSARRLFGYLPQKPAFYNWMTPIEYLEYSARLFDIPQPQLQRSIDEMLALADLQKSAHRKIGGFSGGMVQRLGIAQAMIHNPPVLILDEPTSSLDPAGRYEILDLISSLRGRTTVFLSSHILADIERVCDTIAIIRNGRLELVADRDDLLNQYTANLIELEVEPEDLDALVQFSLQVKEFPWVVEASVEQATLRITVTEREVARIALFDLAARQTLPLVRYEWIHPTLEEIFLKVSA